MILGFNVSASKQMANLAQSKGVSLLSHNIIYKLLDMLKVICAALAVSHDSFHTPYLQIHATSVLALVRNNSALMNSENFLAFCCIGY